MRKFSGLSLLGITLGASVLPAAAFELPSIFGEGAVLQRDRPIPIFGTGENGEKVRVSLNSVTATATVKDGHWKAELPALAAGGPFVLNVESDKGKKSVKNVMVGEVWVLAGQSNIRWQLGRTLGSIASRAIAEADGRIRYFEGAYAAADKPQDDVVRGKWTVGDSAGAPQISTVGFYFARALEQKLGVPVGLVQTGVGGSMTTPWMDRQFAQADPILNKILQDYDANAAKEPGRIAAEQARYDEAVEAAKKAGQPIPEKSRRLLDGPHDNTWERRPGGYYNARVAPILPFEARGVIWYQGESNSTDNLPDFMRTDYAYHVKGIVDSWRAAANRPDWPFLIVQLPAHAGGNTEFVSIRAQQEKAARLLSNVGLVVSIDTGEREQIHPPDKLPIGQRLAQLGEEVIATGKTRTHSPLLKSVEFKEGAAIVAFDQTDGGLVKTDFTLDEFIAVTRGAAPNDLNVNGFELAGKGGKFVNANAKIRGERIEVRAKGVAEPKAVRYLWTRFPEATVSLYSKNGNPVAPFRFPAE